ncbi:MAG: galactokinase [Lentisphaerae bacterium RIFOXYB12_FULL_65_16]|nr:MAG: galactokinase [Lentisphaerae bacterium RIFOXYA12_64_32]OGV85192.1 MAG: galactokinase [Lentisphaerae bacterium RIFOXYB12_FULL_65_16]
MAENVVQELVAAFEKEYGRAPDVVTRAPGRVEMLGNHTDYNEGVVLSVAVDRSTYVAAAGRSGKECRVRSVQSDSARKFHLEKLSRPKKGDWANYVKGLVVELQKRGIPVPTFDAVIVSTIPMSAGMSSSAALEMSVAFALAELGGISLSWQDWARVGQGSENNYVGAMTGLMDQFSSLRGRKGQLVLSDFRTLEVKNVPLPAGTSLVIANCMVKHNLTGEYNERRERCNQAVAFFRQTMPNIKALRDITRADLEKNRAAMEDVVYRRALHVVGENERVQDAAAALAKDDVRTFGRLMFESHESSRINFENSCEELDILVEIGKTLPGALGARLSGGGFGGATIHLVVEKEAEGYARALRAAYRDRTNLDSEVMICHAENGAEVLQKRSQK